VFQRPIDPPHAALTEVQLIDLRNDAAQINRTVGGSTITRTTTKGLFLLISGIEFALAGPITQVVSGIKEQSERRAQSMRSIFTIVLICKLFVSGLGLVPLHGLAYGAEHKHKAIRPTSYAFNLIDAEMLGIIDITAEAR
jgi:hypothetical protein